MAWMNGYRPQGYRNRLIMRRLPVSNQVGLWSNRRSMRSFPISGRVLAIAAFIWPVFAQPAAQNGGDTAPSLIYRSEPEYSAEATRVRAQSNVMLSVVIGEDGRAHDVHVTQGAGFGLDEKAV